MSETVTSRKLYVKYSTEGETSVSHSMPVREDVTGEEVSTVADTIISKNVFGDSAGNLLAVAERLPMCAQSATERCFSV